MHSYNNLGQLVRDRLGAFSTQQACDDLSSNRTYQTLKQDADNIQTQLRSMGVQANDRVCICTTKSCESYAGLLALVSAGVCYVPIDPLAPPIRINDIIEDSRPKGMLIDVGLANLVANVRINAPQHRIQGTELIYVDLGFEQHTDVNRELAYILYTSGSTGQPKGVLISHDNALSFIHWAVMNFDLSAADTFASVAPFHFDLSIFDLFVSLYWGARVVLFNDQHIRNPLLLAQQIETRKISVWYSTPTVLTLIERYGKLAKYSYADLHTVLFAGELLPFTSLKGLKLHWRDADFYNLYGPTETNVCSWAKVPEPMNDTHDVGIIGQPCNHSRITLLSHGMVKTLIVGLEGELLINGATVSLGYLNNDDLTTEKFIVCDAGNRWYRSGDQVRVLDGLRLKYLGRLDRMIKRRGYRIELDEIQCVIERCEVIRRAAVIATLSTETQRDDPTTDIVAFYEVNASISDSDASLQCVQAHIEQQLPHYMWPDHWVCLDNLPITSNAKIDYQALNTYGWG